MFLVIFGVIGGILGGMGMGGGTLLIPFLTLFGGLSQIESQGINLISFSLMAIMALIIHLKNELVNYQIAIPIIITGVIFSCLGSLVANSINSLTLKTLFGIFLLMLGLFQLASVNLSKKN